MEAVELDEDGKVNLDSFLDSLPGHLRMKVIRQLDPEAAPTEAVHVGSPETAPGGPTAWQKALLVALVAPVLLSLYVVVLSGYLADRAFYYIANYTKEKVSESY